MAQKVIDGEMVEVADETAAASEQAMKQAGVATEVSGAVDYFAFEEVKTISLPDGVQYIEHRVLNEGAKKKYQNLVNRDLILERASGNARMKMQPGDERHALLTAAICGWKLIRGGNELQFSPRNLAEFLDKAPPRIIELIEKEVRKANPWLLAEMSVEDIDKEIANLQEMRDAKVKEDEGNFGSSTR